MNRKLAATAFLITLLNLIVIGTALAQTATVGVGQGDTFKYSLVVNWRSTNPNDTVPVDPNIQNQTEYFQVNVQAVAGTTVTIQTIRHYFNGEQMGDTETVDVSTGEGNSTFIYSANLNRGSFLFPGTPNLPWTINETVPHYYGNSVLRTTNHVLGNLSDVEGLTFSLLDIYFDQATGIVVESHWTYAYTSTPQQTITQNLVLTETNLWTIAPSPTPSETPIVTFSPETSPTPTQNQGSPAAIDPLIIALIAAIAVAALIVIVALTRRGKKTPAKPAPQKPPAPARAETPKTEAKTTLTCLKCGQENPLGSEFCNKCGNKL